MERYAESSALLPLYGNSISSRYRLPFALKEEQASDPADTLSARAASGRRLKTTCGGTFATAASQDQRQRARSLLGRNLAFPRSKIISYRMRQEKDTVLRHGWPEKGTNKTSPGDHLCHRKCVFPVFEPVVPHKQIICFLLNAQVAALL